MNERPMASDTDQLPQEVGPGVVGLDKVLYSGAWLGTVAGGWDGDSMSGHICGSVE